MLMKKFFVFGFFNAILMLAAADATTSASSLFYSLSAEEVTEGQRSGALVAHLKPRLPDGAILQEICFSEPWGGRYNGIFVRYTQGGSATHAPTTEVLGIMEGGSHNKLSCRELIRSKAGDLRYEKFFFDSTDQSIHFAVVYIRADTKDEVVQEIGISLFDGNVLYKTVLDTRGTKECVRGCEQSLGRLTSYEVLRGDTVYFYMGDSVKGFNEVTHFLTTEPCFILNLMCNQTKYFYQRRDNTDGTTQLRWLNPDRCLFEETNFKNEFCSLVLCAEGNYEIFIVDPQNPKDILGQLFWDRGIIRPKWRSEPAQKFFDDAEAAIRAKLRAEGHRFSDVAFDYQTLQVELIDGIRTIHGELQFVGFDDATAGFSYGVDNILILNVSDINPARSIMFYNYELSMVRGDADTNVHYSIFRPTSTEGSVDLKKTLVYIPGGPWSHFNTHNFLRQYKPFIAEGHTVVVPHEPLRQGFGYNYSFAQKQLGKRNLHYIMNILDDAARYKGVNPQIVLMGESYGGWVASALAARWKDFVPKNSPIELQGCIAQAAVIDLKKWQEDIQESGREELLTTFSDNPIEVTSITDLQAPLLICHGLGDAQCSIESIQAWVKSLRISDQKVAFITMPEGHTSILASSSEYSAKECELRLNIVRRFFESRCIPAASTKQLGEYGIEVLYDNLSLFESSYAMNTATAATAKTQATYFSG